ncbi:MAG: alanine racemase, partial [Candidatus Eremiobacteraeota bacterium]|nr:alanine racemase [Candidatus Eremiobacteraeota bacterium]
IPRDARRHFVGHVQTNKARALVEHFDLIHAIDRLPAGVALARAARHLGVNAPPVLVQVNISPQERYGVPLPDAPALAERLRELGLAVEGTMAIGPLTEDRAEISAAFERAADVHRRIGGEILSLGMSGDWHEAIACGATMLRIGTAIFGPRRVAKGDPSK